MKLIFRPRFSLRTLLLLVTVFTVWLGLTVSRARKQMAAVDAVVSLGGSVYYDFQIRNAGTTIRIPPGTVTTPDGQLSVRYGGGTMVVANELHSYRLPKPPDHPVPKWIRNRVVGHMFTSVIAVHLEDSRFADRDAKCFEGLPNIRLLSLSRTRISDKTLAYVAGLKKLEHLAIDGTNVEGPGLVHLEHLLRLETLELHDTDVTDDGIRYLTPPRNLKSLRLDRTRIGDDGLAYTRLANDLEMLSLSHSNVSGRGLRFLADKPVERLNLAYTPIEDKGLSYLADCPSLRTLSLEHSRLNDSGLEKLTELHFLDKLQLPWVAHRTTHISVSAARRIEKALPDTEISYPP